MTQQFNSASLKDVSTVVLAMALQAQEFSSLKVHDKTHTAKRTWLVAQ
jgi:hypothetical protein